MPSREKRGKGRKPNKTKRRPRQSLKAKESSLLILECDAIRLADQSISIAQDLHGIVRTYVPNAVTSLVQATSQHVLLSELAWYKEEHGRFTVIVVVGHSNVSGLQLTGDNFASWEAFARWLEPFQPKRIVLVACEAGRWLPSKALFEGITTLQEIYGSPVPTTVQQASVVKILVPYLLSGHRLSTEFLRLMQLGNFLFTGGVLFRQTRKDFRRAGTDEAAVWTGLEELLKVALAR
jgi:hypothetical protein